MTDDRISCHQCSHLSGDECHGMGRRYAPVTAFPLRCAQFQPLRDAEDQRPGRVRWPSLWAEYEAVIAERKIEALRGIAKAKRGITELDGTPHRKKGP